MADVVVLGQVGRDLVLRVPALPDAGSSAEVGGRCELLGGKGANQAVALAQLGVRVALVGVVGDDRPGAEVLAQAADDGVDVGGVVRRPGGTTALLVDLVEDGGRRRLLEDVPEEVLLTAGDVAAAAVRLGAARVVSLQLQQPGPAVRAALGHVPAGTLVVTDGAPADDATRAAVLGRADVVRADAAEAELLTGRALAGVDDVRAAAGELLAAGPRVVALDAGEAGDLVAWRAGPGLGGDGGRGDRMGRDGGEVLVPRLGGAAVDPTGAGDTYVAALLAALSSGAAPEDAAWTASAAAALTVAHAGGRPDLHPEAVRATVRSARAS